MLLDFVSCLLYMSFFLQFIHDVCEFVFFSAFEDTMHSSSFCFCLWLFEVLNNWYTQSIATLNSDTENNCWHTKKIIIFFMETTNNKQRECNTRTNDELKRGFKMAFFYDFVRAQKYVLIFVIAASFPLAAVFAMQWIRRYCLWICTIQQNYEIKRLSMVNVELVITLWVHQSSITINLNLFRSKKKTWKFFLYMIT